MVFPLVGVGHDVLAAAGASAPLPRPAGAGAQGLTWGGVDVATWALHARDLSGLLALPGRWHLALSTAGHVPVVRADGSIVIERSG